MFPRPESSYRGRPGRRGGRPLRALVVLLLCARPLAAQFPGELRGRVVADGHPLPAARVQLVETGDVTSSDGAGAFALRALEAGRYTLRVTRPGFIEATVGVDVADGRTTQVTVRLTLAAVPLEGVAVAARRVDAAAVFEHEAIVAAGARTAGDVLRGVPGVVLREETPGGPQTVSIRGSGPDAVLVLVDGVPLNDPVTGEADLSTLPASSLQRVTVLVGAQGARYGAGAEAGVVLVETRSPEGGLSAGGAAGSLGEWAAEGEAGRAGLGVGGRARGIRGSFDYPRVPGADETPQRRINADLAEQAVWVTGARGDFRARFGAEQLERGIPGKGFDPSPRARQEMGRVRGSVGWRNDVVAVALAGVSQRTRYRDPAPPVGFPYDERSRVGQLEARAEAEVRGFGGGVEARRQEVEATSLAEGAPGGRTDLGLFAHARWRWLAFEGRLDRGDAWYASHAVTLRVTRPAFAVHLANRSGYSPPSLGDQFFREGVAVQPNPALRAERIPSEWELGATVGRAGVRLYTGDVRGMIVWQPDFRFVWSPVNTNVRRQGLEAWGETGTRLRLAGSYALTAISYDRPGDVQLAYRPRHSAQLSARCDCRPWNAALTAHFIGTRYPAAAPVNALPAFWTLGASVSREWGGVLTTALHVDRLLDEKDSLIFGFPDPGRRVRLEVKLSRNRRME